MPQMNGLELQMHVRSLPKMQDIPFLMVSSEAQKEKVMEALKAGVKNYILKPFNAMELQNKIKQMLSP